MKKFTIFLMMISLMIAPMVMAIITITDTQQVYIEVGQGGFFEVTPATLNFSLVAPSLTPSIGPNVIFDVTGSNVDLNIDSSVSGDSLFNGISFIDNSGPTPVITQINDFSTVLTTTSQVKTFGTQIIVPIGTIPGARTGTITYTVTGPAPSA